MVNIGIIGCGKIAELHAPGYIEHPEARIAAVADNFGDVAKSKADEWGADAYYTDYRDVLDDDAIDGVEILTPHSMHRQMIIDALDAGKHVSVQKPMVISLEECNEVVDAAAKSDKIFRLFENFKYYEPLAEAKRMLDEGVIGEPLSLRMKTLMTGPQYGWPIGERTKQWRFDDAISGGGRVTLDYGWHIFAMARILLGNPAQVFGWIGETYSEHRDDIDCPLLLSWVYEGGRTQGSWEAHASNEMVMTSDYYSEDEWFELTGTRGFIWVNRCTGKLLTDTAPLVIHADGETKRISVDEIDSDWASSFKIGTKEFVDSILDGGAPGLSAEEGREIYKFVRASQQSARENRPVSPDEVDY